MDHAARDDGVTERKEKYRRIIKTTYSWDAELSDAQQGLGGREGGGALRDRRLSEVTGVQGGGGCC